MRCEAEKHDGKVYEEMRSEVTTIGYSVGPRAVASLKNASTAKGLGVNATWNERLLDPVRNLPEELEYTLIHEFSLLQVSVGFSEVSLRRVHYASCLDNDVVNNPHEVLFGMLYPFPIGRVFRNRRQGVGL